MNRIKILREEFGYTQQDLANKLECSKSVIGLYENETRKPSLEILVKLSEIFNCSIDYILCKSEYRNDKDYVKNKLEETDKLVDSEMNDFKFAYHKEAEGLTEEEISDALRFYKEMKKRVNKDK